MNRFLKKAAILLCVLQFSCPALYSMAAQHAVILQYHHFGKDTPPSTSVTVEQFEEHLSYLNAHEFSVWPLDKIVSYLQEKKELPDKCVAITVDDAYISVYKRAFPLLQKYKWPFTVFVSTEGVDRGITSYMTWEQMREMSKHGGAFAGHSHTHSYLIHRLEGESEHQWRNRVTKDISTSFERIKEETGTQSRLFAYPYGEYNNDLKNILDSMDLVGFGQQSGAVWFGSDFRVLPRFPMAGGYAEMDKFITKVNSLPLPVVSSEPNDPVLAHDTVAPVLRLNLGEGDYEKKSLACYLSGQGKISLQWIDMQKGIVEVVARSPLPEGRSRYNCTAKHKTQARYFWYSHLWIRTKQ